MAKEKQSSKKGISSPLITLGIPFVSQFSDRLCVGATLCIAFIFRWAVSIGPYSGQGKPPMFGDYEAQRHWMEITYNLPINQWYANSTRNDLLYWGLDYPPLTAYHSWLLGFLSHQFNSSWVGLKSSHGHESYEHKLFMRYSVLISDICLMFPAFFVYVWHIQKQKATTLIKCVYLSTHLLYPGLILVDYGHFQYNCISLGLFVLAVIAIHGNKDLVGSVLFVLSLNYKQMELYHALPFFCYLLGSCFALPWLKGFIKLLKLALTVMITFVIIWMPFLTSVQSVLQIIRRIFPFARGLYEDKVANVWCSLSVLLKLKQMFAMEQLLFASSICCFGLLLPSCLCLLHKPTKHQFKQSLIVSSLIFFLFSFQVHEKSILLVAVPILLIIQEESLLCANFLLVSVLSLYPLCVKDEMEIAFYALFFLYYVWLTDVLKLNHFWEQKRKAAQFKFEVLLFHGSIVGGLTICVLSLFVNPPKRWPDLFVLLNSLYCCVHFLLFLCYFMYRQIVDCLFEHKFKRQ